MPETDDRRARRGTFALFTAAAALGVLGVALLLTGSGGSEHAEPPAAPNSSSHHAGSRRAVSSTPRTTASRPTAETSQTSLAEAPVSLPAPMQKAARDFTIAWASHDARPGRDTSYDDASSRAAAYTAGDLAADLRARRSGTAAGQQWREWTERRVQVTCSVVQVSLPDGAPAPTRDGGFARVIYRVTEKPTSGPSTESVANVALKLRREGGTWRVVGLPDA
ncbi:hypothetical protein [Streptomyces graminilatus]|uniref:hypothetical protein n=1 Tax=Streptomyces graminilatus TaxID=1464070 RepID=UPI0006E3ED7E|nr:hypothetical protein [Streptomyces graminilatus]